MNKQSIVEEFGKEFDVVIYIEETMGDVIIEEPNPSAVEELYRNNLHLSEDGLGFIHIDIDEFLEYMEDF